ncbi:TcdA/TcdB pore-forming domain-containing protein, partial [Providencia alcalifaciens]|uniref:TcdA/TcdB pore-forming domain-containing protein n=1 Tax=Providencia alcalifaciens TaxID=126385 RepID=UPI002B05B980
TTDKTLIEFHDYYENQILTFEKFYYFEGNEIRPKGGDVEVVPIDGLNAGIAIQSLIQWASDKNRNEGSNKGNSPDLEFALKMQTYVSYSMMAQGAMNDAMKVTELVQKVLADDTKMAIEAMDGFSSSLVRNTNEGLGVIFNGAVVGLDLYELSHAENESQKVIFGTQLAFDSAGLITSTAGLGAGVLGASSTSAVLGVAGVLISGLGIGFAGLARNFSDIGKDAKSVGRYFYLLDKAYQGNGYDYLSDKKVLVPRFGAIFKVIDLREKQVEFDSQYIYRTSPNSAGGGRKNYIFWAGDFPVM